MKFGNIIAPDEFYIKDELGQARFISLGGSEYICISSYHPNYCRGQKGYLNSNTKVLKELKTYQN